jgi:protein-disulfide isomerase
MFPKGCLAARAAKAAGILGGADGFWRMHEWLMVNQATFSEQTLAAAAPSLGFDPATLNGTMLGTAVDAAIVEDVKHGRYMIPKGLPTIYVNGKFIPRWMREGDNVLERIINEASGPGRQPANALP